MDRKKTVKIALVSYWFYPNTIVSARRAFHIYQYINRYRDLRLDIFTGSFNREYPVQDRFPVDLTNVMYIKLYKNNFEKNIFSEKNAFFHLLNRSVYLGRAEKRLGMKVRRLKGLRDYDILYFSMGPFSPLLKAAYAIKKQYPEKRVIVEYRDEWVDGAVDYAARKNLIHPYNRWRNIYRRITNYLSNHTGNRLEKKVLPVCDAIVVISREMIKHFIRRIPELSPGKFKYIPNGISDKEIAQLEKWRREKKPLQGKTLRVMYAGTLFGTQDIRPFLDAVRSLIKDGRVAPDEIGLNIFGKHEGLWNEWPDYLKQATHYRDWVPRDEVIRQYFAHDVILFIIGDWPKSEITMTGKIFELIESRQPILALLPMGKSGCARYLLEKTNAAYLADINRPDSIKEAITYLMEEKRTGRKIDKERQDMDWFYRQYHYRNICRRLYEECFRWVDR